MRDDATHAAGHVAAADMTAARVTTGRGRSLLLLALFALSLACFCRTGFFYYWDEWTNLGQLSTMPFGGWVLRPDAEHFMPLHKLLWGMEVRLAGEWYRPLVVANCLVLAAVGVALVSFLVGRGVAAWLALLTGAFYVSSYANWEVATWGWQLGIALAALFPLLAFDRHLRPDRWSSGNAVLVGLFGLLAAWSQGAGLMVLPCVTASAFVSWATETRRGRAGAPLWVAALYAGLFGFVVAVYIATKIETGPTLLDLLRGTPTLGARTRLLADWAVFSLCMSFFGPLWFLAGASRTPDLFYGGAGIAVAFLLGTGAVLWRSRWRGVLILLVVYQMMIMAAVGYGRMSVGQLAGYSYRYQTYALWPVLAILVFALQSFVERGWRAVAVTAVVLALVGITHNVRLCRTWLPMLARDRGEQVRANYLEIKRGLTAAPDAVVPNGRLPPTSHPFFQFDQVAGVIGLLDPATRSRLPSGFRNITLIEQTAMDRPWGEIYASQRAVQTLRFDRPGWIGSVQLVVATYGHDRVPNVVLTVQDDAGTPLARAVVPHERVLNNAWLSVVPPPVHVEPGREYRLVLSARTRDPSRAITLWTSNLEASYPAGATVRADGTSGDWTFRVAYSEDG